MPNEHQIKTAIEGNLCRCTGYSPIIKALKTVAKYDVQIKPKYFKEERNKSNFYKFLG